MNANISNKVRRDIYKRDGFRCALCDSTDGLQIHHVIHRGKAGGRENPMNLICLCWRCHSAAHGSVYQLDDYAFAVIQDGMSIDEKAHTMMDYMEQACIEYVADYYAEQGEIWYPF